MSWKIVLFGLVFVPRLAGAQVVTLGAHGGVNLSRTDGADSVVRPVAGASLDLLLSPPFALRLEAEYGEKGARVQATAGASGPTDYTLGYLALPINLRYDVLTGRVPVYLFAGTTLGALLFATATDDGMSTSVRDQIRPIDVTLDLGGGIGYRMSPNFAVMVDVRYSFGLIDDVKSEAALAVDSWKTRDIKVVFGVTYTFNPLAPSSPSLPGMPQGF
jgi:opacity protein-like surface antigen